MTPMIHALQAGLVRLEKFSTQGAMKTNAPSAAVAQTAHTEAGTASAQRAATTRRAPRTQAPHELAGS